MEFTTLPLAEAEGCLLAHSLMAGGERLRKGLRLAPNDIAALQAAGLAQVTVLRLQPGDLEENAAAEAVARRVAGGGLEASRPATGRVNLYAEADGILCYRRASLDAMNRVDEAITLSALEPGARVERGQLAATIKIIPLAVEAAALQHLEAAAPAAPVFSLAPFQPKAVGLLQTTLPGVGEKLLEKTRTVTAAKLESCGARLVAEEIAPHSQAEVEAALARLVAAGVELLLVVGASATTDRRDVIPAAVTAGGGRIERFGMPVDPGNLLLVAELSGRPLLALPGSARSPKVGGNDWVLWRLLAGLTVTSDEIAAMGAGGLLKEDPARPLPRVSAAPRRRARPASLKPRIAAVVLAAGRSSRMGEDHKLLADLGGEPVLSRTLQAVAGSAVGPVVVVTGARSAEVSALVPAREGWRVVHNPNYGEGMAGSLAAGIAALPGDVDGVLVVLGDMPLVRGETLDRIIAGFQPDLDRLITLPLHQGKRGHPVLFTRRFLPELAAISGDRGARELLRDHAEVVAEVPVEDVGVLLDLDTPEALAEARRRLGEAPA